MSIPTLDPTFIELYTSEVLRIYQDEGFRLPAFCRPAAVQGETLYWHTMDPVDETTAIIEGKSDFEPFTFATQSHGKKSMNTIDLEQPHAVREMDLLRTNIDYRSNYISNQMAAMGRKADSMVRAAHTAGKNATILGPGSAVAMTVNHLHELRETFDMSHIPADGRRYMFVGPRTWSMLLMLPEFVRSDFIGDGQLPYAGNIQAKEFQTFKIMQDPGIPSTGTVEHNMVWYEECMGWGTTAPPSTEISRHNERSAWLTVTRMAVGAKAIDDVGIYGFDVDTAAGVDSVYHAA